MHTILEKLHEIDYDVQHSTGFKQYLINILMQGKITCDDLTWLASALTFKSLLSKDQVNLLECIFDDLASGFIQVVVKL
ncbi:MAG: hypothetical protein NZ772_04315 [Cyanobacteria bacterium]|nr:hypothetical protein [Cyanobacteriota bacterium]MDW8201170.1 hypothetical protein [Cyanobacteriota bacterium SKYGB_h_bin112]